MYQALYRKWRPNSFDDVVGQKHITETLKRQLASDRLSHAYLFVGTRGTGKTTCAKILAKAVNCENPVNGNPCNKCRACLGIDSGAILDVEELDAASNNSVDNIRTLRDEAVFTPASVKKRVYIVDEVHMLSTAAFNALLKILEEPPEHLIFILATTEIRKVPATILSRCQRFSFKRISPEEISGRLDFIAANEDFELKDDASRLLARLADGSMRDALSLLDQCASTDVITAEHVLASIGLAGAAETVKLLENVINGDVSASLDSLDKMYFCGKDVSSVLKELMTLMRDILLKKVAPKGVEKLASGNFGMDVINFYAEKIRAERLLNSVNALQQAIGDMAFSQDKKITAEMCLIKLCDESLSQDVDALRSRVASLEDQIKNGQVKVSYISPEEVKAEKVSAPVSKPEPVAAEKLVENVPEAVQEVKAEEKTPEKPAEKEKTPVSFEKVWSEMLKMVKDKVDIPQYSFLSDKMHCYAVKDGDVIYIKTKNAFAMQMLDTMQVKLAVKDAAETICGGHFTVKIAEDDAEVELKTDKLDALKKFKNITFE